MILLILEDNFVYRDFSVDMSARDAEYYSARYAEYYSQEVGQMG